MHWQKNDKHFIDIFEKWSWFDPCVSSACVTIKPVGCFKQDKVFLEAIA